MKCPYCKEKLFIVVNGRHKPVMYNTHGVLAHRECLDKLKAKRLAKAQEEREQAKQMRLL